jgi:uncharacterized membrane protein
VLVRLTKLQDDIRSSLFFVPMLFVIGGVALGEAMLFVDDRVEGLPSRLTATVDSARNVLSVVAGATLSFAGIAFSVSLLLISLASSQFSPRVVHGLFRDPFNKRVMGVVIGTFTYCLVVMRAVRGPLEDSGAPVVPSVSILVAVFLGVVSILSIVGFISHSAHTMDVSKILHSVTEQSIESVCAAWEDPDGDGDGDGEDGDEQADATEPDGEGAVVVLDRHGWVQQIDYSTMLELLDAGACMRVDTAPGRYAIPNTPLCTIWPAPDDPDDVADRARAAVIIGETRTTQQDSGYGLRQLADVALKALSPGVNDPTTAQDALFHLGAVVREMLVRNPPSAVVTGPEGRRLLTPQTLTHDEVIGSSFNEVRLAAAGQPTVQIYLLEILHLLRISLDEDRPARSSLEQQAALIAEHCDVAGVPHHDVERVRAAYAQRFQA